MKIHSNQIPVQENARKKLSPKHLQAIELLADGASFSNTYRALKINESTLYRWRQDEEFQNELYKRTNELLREKRPSIYCALAKKAINGDVPAARLILQHLGDFNNDYLNSDDIIINVGICDDLDLDEK